MSDIAARLHPQVDDVDRRSAVLQVALLTFARYGYRKTSMDQVARDADISRPGLYFLFSSKQALFREAVERSLEDDLASVADSLAASGVRLLERLLHAFDHWTARYLGPLTRDIATVVEDNPDMLGTVAAAAPQQFARQITDAIATELGPERAARVSETLISASIGVKHQVDDRTAYLRRMRIALDLLLPPGSSGAS